MSECREIINKGKNAGRICCETSVRCRHIIKTCAVCGEEFNRPGSYSKHIAKCAVKLKPVITLRENNGQTTVINKIIDELKDLKTTVNRCDHGIRVLTESTPHIINNNNIVIYQNITISDAGVFKILCDKMGVSEATAFLCDMAGKPQIMTLFEKAYLDCDPANYPIAHNNGTDLYYRDSNNNIVHDAGGRKISKLGERLMKNTMLEAAEPLLARFISQNEGEHDGDDNDYDRFRELQNGACRYKEDHMFTKSVFKKTYNPNHVFFSTMSDLHDSIIRV